MILAANVRYMKKDALQAELKERGFSDERVAEMKRETMIAELQKLLVPAEALNNIEPEEVPFNPAGLTAAAQVAVTEVKTAPVATAVEQEAQLPDPNMGDKGWTEWVLGQLEKDEIYEKYPTCDGLFRLFEKLVGSIHRIDTKVVQTAVVENHNRATVVCTLEYQKFGSHLELVISDAADCSSTNTDYPFNQYPSATASTMALGRCLRKAMRLKTLVREEVTRPDEATARLSQELDADMVGASDTQKNMIHKLSQNLGVDPVKLLKFMASDTNSSTKIRQVDVSLLSHAEAQAVMRKLQEYNKNDGMDLPKEVIED